MAKLDLRRIDKERTQSNQSNQSNQTTNNTTNNNNKWMPKNFLRFSWPRIMRFFFFFFLLPSSASFLPFVMIIGCLVSLCVGTGASPVRWYGGFILLDRDHWALRECLCSRLHLCRRVNSLNHHHHHHHQRPSTSWLNYLISTLGTPKNAIELLVSSKHYVKRFMKKFPISNNSWEVGFTCLLRLLFLLK